MEIQQHIHNTEEKRVSKLFDKVACPFCCSPLDSLDLLVVNELSGLPECPMCIEIRVASEGEYRR